jgi:hypothetical protein
MEEGEEKCEPQPWDNQMSLWSRWGRVARSFPWFCSLSESMQPNDVISDFSYPSSHYPVMPVTVIAAHYSTAISAVWHTPTLSLIHLSLFWTLFKTPIPDLPAPHRLRPTRQLEDPPLYDRLVYWHQPSGSHLSQVDIFPLFVYLKGINACEPHSVKPIHTDIPSFHQAPLIHRPNSINIQW